MRQSVEDGPFLVRAESCYLCGIRCHKNVYDEAGEGGTNRFRAKVDYEPIALLSSNLGVFDPSAAFDLIHLADSLGFDSISLGVTLGYAMEWNARNPDRPICGGLAYGDIAGIKHAIRAVADGNLPEVAPGVKRHSEEMGDTSFAMHSKGVEYPAYQPQTNPGYPWALAGGHMSMKTFFNLVLERETDLDYWVDAITNRGWLYLVDDITGLCKFANVSPDLEAEALGAAAGLEVTGEELAAAAERTFLRGYADERLGGFSVTDYRLPAEAHQPMQTSNLPYFNTEVFFEELRRRVTATFEERAAEAGFLQSPPT
jgi:aldehyde:ferredoxin oxidoreductase